MKPSTADNLDGQTAAVAAPRNCTTEKQKDTKVPWTLALPKKAPKPLPKAMSEEKKKKEFLEWLKEVEDPVPFGPDVLEAVHKLLTESGVCSQGDLIGADE